MGGWLGSGTRAFLTELAGKRVDHMVSFISDLVDLLHHPYIACIIFVALVFDFLNGFHDAANSIATVVGTRVLRPFHAVLWAAWWNFVAAWVFGIHVANTVATWVHTDYVTADVILAGLLGASGWDLLTWYVGLPTSSSHALLGGFVGAALTAAGHWAGVLEIGKVATTVMFIVIAPLIGLILALAFLVALSWSFRRASPGRVDRLFRLVQLGSAAAYSLGHGTNDAQKTMGVIAALLYASVWQHEQGAFIAGTVAFPFWIVLVCHFAIGLGTLAGGRRIIKTMAMKLARLRPYQGACAELAAAISLFGTSALGIPVSTTHTIVGAIVGVGAAQKLSAVRWGIARSVVLAWILTIPAAGLLAVIAYELIVAVRTYANP
jgi:inorganic phosphate transporter, PiT family